jgi:hypothetical protein
MVSNAHYDKWKWQAPLGLTTVGFGASLLGHASNMKGRGASAWKWIAAGTVSLVVLNAGLSLFGDAVKHRALHEWEHRARTESDLE